MAKEKGTIGGLREEGMEAKHAMGNAVKRRLACLRSEKQKYEMMIKQDTLMEVERVVGYTKPLRSRKRRKGAAA